MLSVEAISIILIGYVIGSIPWAVIVSKRAGVNIFSVGSGNPGATNVLRTLWGLPAAVLGHTYPIFTGFRGGKGVATAMGGLLALMPFCLIVGLFFWVLTFYLTKYVALASIAFGLSLPVCSLFFSPGEGNAVGQTVLAFIVMAWIIWRHRSNISRLRDGTENRFKKKSTKSTKPA
jgi:glycerol-3-phosphate acyltransferase PlsY